MTTFADHVRDLPSRREPPYRQAAAFSSDERQSIIDRLGDEALYNVDLLRHAIEDAPDNPEFKNALVQAIASIEFAAIDSFSRKVCEWQDRNVPASLTMALARQTWDEVRHAQLGKELVETYGGHIGQYPDTFGGQDQNQRAMAADPLASLSATNVSLEGAGLALFSGMTQLAHRAGDPLLEHCFDYNWADEVTHVQIGDYFVRKLCLQDADAERRALGAQALAESVRGSLSESERAEIAELFADEIQRGIAALGPSA